MKHIRKFNESNDESLDIEYIETCFRDVIENDNFRKEYIFGGLGKKNEYQLEISTWPKSSVSFDINNPINQWFYNPVDNDVEITEFFENWAMMSKSVDSAIKNLSDEYPEYTIKKRLCKSPTLKVIITLK